MQLIVTDIDNTVFDWVRYYVSAIRVMLSEVSEKIDAPYGTLLEEARAVFTEHASIEYPFLVQELPSVMAHYGEDIDTMLAELVDPARETFRNEAVRQLSPYEGVIDTFKVIREKLPGIPVVALTDAPRYVAMWKLNKLGMLGFYDAVYGLADPRIPTDAKLGRVKVNPKILLKHLQQSNFGYKGKIRILPDEYEKPGVRGLKTVLMDFGLDETPEKRHEVFWVGDNLRKDVGLGSKLGVTTIWAKYGAEVAPELLEELGRFSPMQNIHKNVNLDPAGADSPVPDHTLNSFSEILGCLLP